MHLLATKDEALSQQQGEIGRLRQEQAEKAESDAKALAERDAQIAAISNSLAAAEQSLAAIQSSRVMRFATTLKQPPSMQQARDLARLSGAMLLPEGTKRMLRPVLRAESAPTGVAPAFRPYVAKAPTAAAEGAPRILHVIANFMTGGSSRLVTDLYEHLGHRYAQEVLTSCAPNPPHYLNVPIQEIRLGDMPTALGPLLDRFAPNVIHVHYWGECDEPWYREAFRQAEARGITVIENVNTPVAPYRASCVVEYVFVSNYVRKTFGTGLEGTSSVIYPGSDLAMFRPRRGPPPSECIGMVYRLEPDKLDEAAIEPFIYVVRNRPQVQVLIVGSGSLEGGYRSAVKSAGLDSNFTFTGYVAYEKLPVLYARMAVFVAPVWKESFGQVSSFAMNMGIPVAGYDVGALGEILAPRDLLAPPGDTEALGRIILGLLDDPVRSAEIGKEGQRRVQEEFTVQAMVQKYNVLYRRICERD